MTQQAVTSSTFSSYDKRVVSDEQIQAWADEAETGDHVDALNRIVVGKTLDAAPSRCRSWPSGSWPRSSTRWTPRQPRTR